MALEASTHSSTDSSRKNVIHILGIKVGRKERSNEQTYISMTILGQIDGRYSMVWICSIRLSMVSNGLQHITTYASSTARTNHSPWSLVDGVQSLGLPTSIPRFQQYIVGTIYGLNFGSTPLHYIYIYILQHKIALHSVGLLHQNPLPCLPT